MPGGGEWAGQRWGRKEWILYVKEYTNTRMPEELWVPILDGWIRDDSFEREWTFEQKLEHIHSFIKMHADLLGYWTR